MNSACKRCGTWGSHPGELCVRCYHADQEAEKEAQEEETRELDEAIEYGTQTLITNVALGVATLLRWTGETGAKEHAGLLGRHANALNSLIEERKES